MVYNGYYVKFEFNDKVLHTKHDSEKKKYIMLELLYYIYNTIIYDCV